MISIKQIMTSIPQFCMRSDTIKAVAHRMVKYNTGFLPVIDENEKVIGTITDRDICVALGNTDKSINELRIQEIMNPEVYTVYVNSDTTEALKIMRIKKVGRLPVVDKENRLEGVISLMRIARKINCNSKKGDLLYKGEETILNTLCAVADRSYSSPVLEYLVEE